METYYNLTQCAGERMVYFRSTDVEQKNYHRLLWAVPDEWLFLLSSGANIGVVDKSSNGSGKIERIFIPTLNDVLNSVFFGHLPTNKRTIAHFHYAMEALERDKSLLTKFKFWRGKVSCMVDIKARTIRVHRETNPVG